MDGATAVGVLLDRAGFVADDDRGWRHCGRIRAVVEADDGAVTVYVFCARSRGVLEYQVRLSLGMPLSVIGATLDAIVAAGK
mgnify:CR=1 FL=1